MAVPLPGAIADAVRGQKKPNKLRKPVASSQFKPGDQVQIKSGGFRMTVYGLVDTCATEGEHVEVIWAHGRDSGDTYRDICRDVVPCACLKHADLIDNIPF